MTNKIMVVKFSNSNMGSGLSLMVKQLPFTEQSEGSTPSARISYGAEIIHFQPNITLSSENSHSIFSPLVSSI
jgi:hypothetical protein